MGESKKEKANNIGVPLINESDFLKLIGKEKQPPSFYFNKKLLGLHYGIIQKYQA